MRTAPAIVIAAISLFLSTGCGHEIGDACAISSECSPQGDRICDTTSPGGYCTIRGCDWDTCPDESVCVRFFSVEATNIPCDPATEDQSTDDCSPTELCTLSGSCVPRAAEVRFCMRRCSDGGDCRDNYECRDEELMRAHGGEPVPRPGETLTNVTSFCAVAPFN